MQLGSSNNAITGWFNTDLKENQKIGIYRLDASKKFPFEDCTFDYVFSEHMIEHLSYPEQKNMLSECYRVLKPNGVLRTNCPTLDYLVWMLQNQDSPKTKAYSHFHCSQFDKQLMEDFKDVPFSLVFNNCMHMWGHKNIFDKSTLVKML